MTLAKCEGCGKPLIVPYDGLPFWCIECSRLHIPIPSEYDKVLNDIEKGGLKEMAKFPVSGTIKNEGEIVAYWAGYIAATQLIRNKFCIPAPEQP